MPYISEGQWRLSKSHCKCGLYVIIECFCDHYEDNKKSSLGLTNRLKKSNKWMWKTMTHTQGIITYNNNISHCHSMRTEFAKHNIIITEWKRGWKIASPQALTPCCHYECFRLCMSTFLWEINTVCGLVILEILKSLTNNTSVH